ncbi:MAG: hypothetical protein IH897_13960 [Planctomycetes bacterium]|nr:hypothetical protein [Planctomycetota bacterium]
MYMLKKTVRRHRGQIALVVAATIVLSFSSGIALRYVRDLRLRARADQLIDQAALDIQRGKLHGTKDMLDRAIEMLPSNGRAYLYRGMLGEISGLAADLNVKKEFVRQALQDFETARRALVSKL